MTYDTAISWQRPIMVELCIANRLFIPSILNVLLINAIDCEVDA